MNISERAVYTVDKEGRCKKRLFKTEKKALAFILKAERKGLRIACYC